MLEKFNAALTDPRLPLVLDNSIKLLVCLGALASVITLFLFILRLLHII